MLLLRARRFRGRGGLKLLPKGALGLRSSPCINFRRM
ncbi:hypothetical protein X975_08208, partial [Stegodyphus mimosarum]